MNILWVGRQLFDRTATYSLHLDKLSWVLLHLPVRASICRLGGRLAWLSVSWYLRDWTGLVLESFHQCIHRRTVRHHCPKSCDRTDTAPVSCQERKGCIGDSKDPGEVLVLGEARQTSWRSPTIVCITTLDTRAEFVDPEYVPQRVHCTHEVFGLGPDNRTGRRIDEHWQGGHAGGHSVLKPIV